MRPRRSPRRVVAPLLALVALCLPISGPKAAPSPPFGDPESTVVEELVVTARSGGPAWWKVSTPTSTVYILGIPEALPKGLKWDQTLLRRRLAGAGVLVGPPQITAGLGDLFPLLAARRHFRSKGPMEARLSPDLRTRYLADRAALTHDDRAYSGWTPLVAGLLMVSDFRHKAGLAPLEPGTTVVKVAESLGVRVIPSGRYRAVPLLRAAEPALDSAGPACLADALDEVEAGPARLINASDGWAKGEVARALTAQRGYEKCLASLPGGADLPARAMTDTTTAIVAALAKPGHSVAVVNLRALVAKGGVLQQLQARGLKVSTPEP